MSLTTDEVRKIATLARLRLTPAEEARFTGQLGKVVDYIDQLRQFEPAAATATPGPPTAAGHDAEDHVRPCLPREVFLANAPAVLDGFLVVPEVKGSDDA